MDAKTKKRVIIGSIIGIALIGSILFLRNRKLRKLKNQIDEGSPDVITSSRNSESKVVFPLVKGAGYTNTDEAECVKLIQRYLNKEIVESGLIPFRLLEEDGKFGSLTEDVLRRVTGTTQVSYTLYKKMQGDMIPVYIKKPEDETEENIFDYLKLN